jgi:hypothetical protein
VQYTGPGLYPGYTMLNPYTCTATAAAAGGQKSVKKAAKN